MTVREFLEKPTVWTRLLGLTKPENFDANTSLLRAKVFMLRIISFHKTEEELKWFDWMDATRMASNAMKIALEAENYTGASQTAVLDELDDTLTQMSNSKRIKWSNPTTKLDFAVCEKPAAFLRYKLDQTLTGFSDSGCTHWSNRLPRWVVSQANVRYLS